MRCKVVKVKWGHHETLNELIQRELSSHITTYDDNGEHEAIDADDIYEISDNLENMFNKWKG